MARTVAAIKTEITTNFMADEGLASAYGFEAGAPFDSVFSKVSLESIIFGVVATVIFTLEVLFDSHKSEVSTLLDAQKPHRPRWYRDKVLAFQFGRSLDDDSDEYNEVVDSERVVKYAAVSEYQGRIFIKVAGGSSTSKAKLTDEQQIALEAYLSEIKDAGVQIGNSPGSVSVTNLNADHYRAEINIYYDPMVFSASGMRLDTGANTVKDTIADFIENQIPFNGEYRNASLVDALQRLDGVIIAQLVSASSRPDASENWSTISVKALPDSGYYRLYDDTDLTLNFIAYQAIESV